jgi:hypothetical protein
MSIRDGQPSPEQARKMARVFVIATLLGGLVVFLNVAMRSYNIRMQQAELKKQQAAGEVTTPTSQASGETTPPSQASGETTPPPQETGTSPTP